MYINNPSMAHAVRRLVMDDLLEEAARERLATQALSGRPSRRVSLDQVKHSLGTALIWIGARIQGAAVSEGVAAAGGAH